MPHPAHASTVALPPALSSSPDMLGMAALGKVVLALLLIIAIILACTWLLRRFGPVRTGNGNKLRIVATRAVGNKERVVILEVEDTWLVLGVTANQITRLHELPATPPAPVAEHAADAGPASFGKHFAEALKQNLRGGRK